MDSVNGFKKTLKASQKESVPIDTSAQQNALSFKLFADIEDEELEKANKISELNNRLSDLEKVFGAGNAGFNETHIAKLCTNIENKSILVKLYCSKESFF